MAYLSYGHGIDSSKLQAHAITFCILHSLALRQFLIASINLASWGGGTLAFLYMIEKLATRTGWVSLQIGPHANSGTKRDKPPNHFACAKINCRE